MRTSRSILVVFVIVACVIGFLWCLPYLLNPVYFGLQHQSAKWYEEFTAACDSVIASHPSGTNEWIAVSVTDPSLPKIITDMHPLKIEAGPQRFWMLLLHNSHAGFGLTWDPKWEGTNRDTNIWVLHTTAESLDTVVYSAKR
jgi:hypothetical protein